jgi:GNAT superfamily N-acetyltransferase
MKNQLFEPLTCKGTRRMTAAEVAEMTAPTDAPAKPVTETPAFKAWFSGSKVVDANGKPLVVYHGTNKNYFDTFKTNGGGGKTDGTGAFFTDDPANAGTYGSTHMPVYLNLHWPLEVWCEGSDWDRLSANLAVGEDPDYPDDELFRALEVPADEWDDFASSDDIARLARKHGYDGVIFHHMKDTGGDVYNPQNTTYVAFKPTQIKSAIGNNGEFNPEIKSITAAVAPADELQSVEVPPAPVSPEFKSWFGASRVVNEDWTPRVVYHGSRTPWLTAFDLRCEGTGCVSQAKDGAIWFSSERDNASWFANYRDKFEANPEASMVYGQGNEWFASINALPESEDGETDALFDIGPYDTEEEAEQEMEKEITAYNAALHLDTFVTAAYLRIENPLYVDEVPRAAEFDAARKGGHDGIIATGVVDGVLPSDIFVVFNPNQIKSATRNTGQYSRGTNRIVASGQTKYYHSTDVSNRESVLEHGLTRRFAEAGDGIFFHTLLTPESRYTDTWEADLTGYNVEPDETTDISDNPEYEGDSWWVVWGQDIPPERLKLVQQGRMLTAARADKDTLTQFMQELWSQTYANPFSNRERVWQDKACIECRPFDGRIHLSFIRSLEKNTGGGRDALKWFCGLADKYGVEIDLNAKPVGDDGLSLNKLRAWYMRNGFVPDEYGDDDMVRLPKGKDSNRLKLHGEMKEIPFDKKSSTKIAKTYSNLYHGTNADFTTFQISPRGSLGSGVYLTDNRESASLWGDTLYRCKVELKNPYFADANFEIGEEFDFDSEAVPTLLHFLGEGTTIEAIASSSDGMFGSELTQAIKNQGYDGIVATYEGGTINVIAFDPAQVTIVKKIQKTSSNEIGGRQFWHGGRIQGDIDIQPSAKGRYEAGPGLYLTTSYARASKYAKGGGSTFLITLRGGHINLAHEVEIPLADGVDFAKRFLGAKGKLIADDLRSNAARMKKETFTAEILINLVVNYEAGSGKKGIAIRNFLVSHNVDASIEPQSNGEQWVVVFNSNIVTKVQKVPASDVSLEMRDLPKLAATSNQFNTILYLDDVRIPRGFGIKHVRNFNEFVQYMQTHDVPDLISFDHDLAEEHLPTWDVIDDDGFDTRFDTGLPYDTYKEGTGREAAQWLVDNHIPVKHWAIHSANPVGRDNIYDIMIAAYPKGYIALNIPHTSDEERVYGGRVHNGWRTKTSAFDLNKVEVREDGYDSGTFVAYVGNRRVGYVSVFRNGFDDEEKARKETHVWKSYVSPRYRRKGVARKLYEVAKQWCAGRGFKLVPTYPALSDEATMFWHKFEPDAVKDRDLWWRQQYVGRQVTVDGRVFNIKSVMGKYPNLNFMGEDPQTNMTTYLKGSDVFPQLGEPEPNPKRDIDVPMSKEGSVEDLKFTELSITAEESSYEGTSLPGIRIEAEENNQCVGAIEIVIDGDKAYVRGVTRRGDYHGQGLGQRLYDHAIAAAKKHGCTHFYSDKANAMTEDAQKAWARLKNRYQVGWESGEDGYDSTGRKMIDLAKTAAISPDTILGWAKGWENGAVTPDSPGYAPAESFDWVEERNFDLHKIEGWDAGYYDGLYEHAKERIPEDEEWGTFTYFNEMCEAIKNHTIEQIFVVEGTDGKFYVWEGNHRVGIAHVIGVDTMPAFVGYPKKLKTASLPEWTGEGMVPHFVGQDMPGKLSKIKMVPIEQLEPTESGESYVSIANMMSLLKNGEEIPAIVVGEQAGAQPYFVIDGHHRLEAAKRLGYKVVPIRIWRENDGEPLPEEGVDLTWTTSKGTPYTKHIDTLERAKRFMQEWERIEKKQFPLVSLKNYKGEDVKTAKTAYTTTTYDATATPAKTMAELKERVREELEYDDNSEERIDEWGIMDDLPITPDGGLMLWRAVRVPKEWVSGTRVPYQWHTNNFGAYWSYTRANAFPYCAAEADGKVDVVVEAQLGPNDVNWEAVWDSIRYFHRQGETEVRLSDNEQLHVKDIYVDGKRADTQLLGTYTLRASKASAWEDHIPRDVMETYSYGYCTRLAMVLNRKFGWPIMVGYEGTPGDKYIKHAWVHLPDGRDLDICGFEGPADFEPFLDVERISDWEDLGEYVGATEQDLAQAEAVMNKYVIPTYLKDYGKTASAALKRIIMYHRTHKSRVEAILRDGLKINSEMNLTQAGVWAHRLYGCNPVYLSMEPDKYERAEASVLLKVDVTGLEVVADLPGLVSEGAYTGDTSNDGMYFEEGGGSFEGMEDISYEDLLTPGTWECDSAIDLTKTAACLDNIPASRITVGE